MDAHRIEAEIKQRIADSAKLHAESMKLHAEFSKMNAETMKMVAEAQKTRAEGKWYPVIGAAAFVGALIGLDKFFH